MEQSKFMAVTDGSAGEIDIQASSFCAEGYVVLSALSFFCRTMEYTASTMTLAFQMYLDNEG
eukprot:2308418-Ditylum_brightwellii.AAC.1